MSTNNAPNISNFTYEKDRILNRIYSLVDSNKLTKSIHSEIQSVEKDPENASLWIALGTKLYEYKKFDNAIECYEYVLMSSPELEYVWYYRGQSLYNLQRYSEAIESFDKAIRLNPDYSNAWNAKGLVLEKQGKKTEAQKCFDHSKEITQNKYTSFINEGKDNLTKSKYNEAIQSFDRAIKIDPENSNAWYYKGQSLYNIQRYSEAIESFDNAIKLNPNDGDAWYYKGNSQFYQGLYNDAIFSYDKSISISRYPMGWSNRGKALDKLGQYEEAIESFDKALQINKDDSDVWYAKGQSLANLGKYDLAIESYEKAIHIDPKNSNALSNALTAKGLALVSQNKYAEALETYEKLIKIDENNSNAWNAKGLVLEKQGKKTEAQKCFDHSKEITQNKYTSFINEGKDNLTKSKYNEAIQFFDRAIKIDPENSNAWYYKGQSLYNQRRYTEAMQCFDNVIKLNAFDSQAWYHKGQSLYNQRRYTEAIECFDNAIKLNANYNAIKLDANESDAWYYKGDSLYKQQNYLEAIISFKKVIEIDPKTSKPFSQLSASQLHDIYSNQLFDANEALNISKAWAASPIFKNKVDYISDLIKTQNYEAARIHAKGLEIQTPNEDTEKRCIIQFILLTIYSLEGNRNKVKDELEQFRTYYSGIGDRGFRIGDKYSFRGLINYIEKKKDLNNNNKDIVLSTLGILKQNEDSNQSWPRINNYIDESNLNKIKFYKKLLATTIPMVAIAAIIIAFLYFQSITPQPSSACLPFKTEKLNQSSFLKIGKPPHLLSIGQKNNYLIFVEESKTSPIISVFDCQSYKAKLNITTPRVLDYAIDEPKNMLYVANANDISIYNLNDPKKSNQSIHIIDPSAMSINPSGNRLYIASKNTSSVTIFDIANKKLIENFTSDEGINLPTDIEFNSFDNKIYVINSGSNTVSVISYDEKNKNYTLKNIYTCDQKYCRNDGRHSLSINNHLNKIYISNYPDHTISVINGNNYTVKNILVGRGPSDLEYDAKNNLLYVLNNESHSISKINGTTDKVIRVIPLAVEISPVSITIDQDSGLVYVASDDIYGSIRIIGPDENVDYIQVGLTPKFLGLNSVTKKLYVSNYDNGNISVLNEITGTSKDIKLFPRANFTTKIIANDITNKIYVTTAGSNTVSVINGNNDTLSKNLYFKKAPMSIAVNTNTNKIYVASIQSPYIDIIDGKSDNLSDRRIDIGINSSHQVAVNALTNKIYVVNSGSNILSVIDGNDDTLTKNVTLKKIAPNAIAIDEKNNLIYLYSGSTEYSYNFAIVNGSNDIPTSIPPVGDISGPAKLAIDPKSYHIFVLDIQAQKIVELYGNNMNLKIVKQLPAGINPNDFLIDDRTNKIYTSNPKLNAILVTRIR